MDRLPMVSRRQEHVAIVYEQFQISCNFQRARDTARRPPVKISVTVTAYRVYAGAHTKQFRYYAAEDADKLIHEQ